MQRRLEAARKVHVSVLYTEQYFVVCSKVENELYRPRAPKKEERFKIYGKVIKEIV
jgi:hypothetical protein